MMDAAFALSQPRARAVSGQMLWTVSQKRTWQYSHSMDVCPGRGAGR